MEKSNEISLYEIFRRLKNKLVMIISITLTAAVISFAYSVLVIKPVYESKIGLIAEMPRQDSDSRITDITMYNHIMSTYMSLAKTSSVAEIASSKLNDVTAQQLLSNVNVTSEISSMVINISMKNSDPVLAYKYVNVYVEAFIEKSNEFLPNGKLTIVDKSGKPGSPISPNVQSNIIQGFIVGLSVSVVLALILEDFKYKREMKNNK